VLVRLGAVAGLEDEIATRALARGTDSDFETVNSTDSLISDNEDGDVISRLGDSVSESSLSWVPVRRKPCSPRPEYSIAIHDNTMESARWIATLIDNEIQEPAFGCSRLPGLIARILWKVSE
jgi:hypothetical protein